MARMIGSGGADKTAEKIIRRRMAADEVNKEPEAEEATTTSAPLKRRKVKDATDGATRDYQMQQAIEMVRKKKSAKRTDYQ